MAKRNRIFRVGSLLLVLCFISTVMISGTFAKYTSEYSGQDTVLIAKWDLEVKEGSSAFALSPAAAAKLDLFSHGYNVNINQTDGAATPNTKYIIAPGVQGNFELKVKNKSDVAAKVEFAFSKNGADVPMEYSLDDFESAQNIYTDLGALATAINGQAKFQVIDVAGTPDFVNQTVYWRWPFERGNDVDDTTLGKASATAAESNSRTSYVLTVTATATQLAPGLENTITAIGSIVGTAKVNETLTAGAITPTGATVNYQWLISGTVDGTYDNILGATNNTYMIVAGDKGKYIKVEATGTGAYSGTIISEARGPIAAADLGPIPEL